MKPGWRYFLLLICCIITSLYDLSGQAAYITDWRNPTLEYCANEGGDTIRGQSPSGKPFYIDGVSYETAPALTKLANGVAILYPNRLTTGTHTIIYGTIGSHDVSVTITITDMPAVSLAPFASVCANTAPYSLFSADSGNVSPKTGTFSGPGVDANGVFDPASAGPGTHSITYTVGLGGCASSVSRTLTVQSLPAVGINPFTPVCTGTAPFLLTQGYPAGGTYSGTGVDASGYFNQAVTGVGSFPITYTYSNGTCSNSAVRDIVVASNPNASFSGLGSQYCTSDGSIGLTGDPAGVTGIFTGHGITDIGGGSATFDPSAAGLGLHSISYIYTSADGCSDTSTQAVQVGTNVVINGLQTGYCINSSADVISGSPAGGSFGALAGLTDNGDGTFTFDPAVAGTGIHTISYTYTDAYGCVNVRSQPVQVYALPTPAILNLSDTYCRNAPSLTISGNYAPLGTFSGPGTTDNGNGTAVFNPSALLAGATYQVTYHYTDPVSSCQAVATSDALINAIPQATLSGDASVCYGDAATLAISLTGAGPFDVTLTDGTGTYSENDIAGPVYNTTVYPADTTLYTIGQVTDNNGCTNSGTGSALINVLPPVAITEHPAPVTTCQGSNVHFAVTAGGVNLQYQWEKDGVPLAGAINPVLSLNNVQPVDLGTYRCRVSGDCGAPITSNEAMLQFWSPAAIITSPSGSHECSGEDFSFTVKATGSNITYQWYKDNEALSDTANYAGTSTADLYLASLTPANSGNYHVVVSGSCGTVATLPVSLQVDRELLITAQPVDVEICEGNNATFVIVATGDGLNYQWQKDGMDIPGETTSTFTIPNAVTANEGFYRCRIVSGCGTAVFSNNATLAVNDLTSIVANPVSITRCENDNATFTLQTTGTEVTYQWQKNGVALSDNAKVNGSTTASLVIYNLTAADEGNYACQVSNSCNTLLSHTAVLTIDTLLGITAQPLPVNACLNTNVSFSITATGNNITYQWHKDGLALPGQNNATLIINNINLSHAGIYTCTVANSCGRSITSLPAALVIDQAVSIIDQPYDLEICQGENAQYIIRAEGTGLVYQWEYNGVPLADGGNISGSQTETLIIQQAGETAEGVYNCLVTGACGAERSLPASLVINDTLVLNSQPSGVIVCEGNNAQFSVSATGALTYQWQKDETDIPGATNPLLTINNVATTDSGVYRCLAMGLCDTLASDGALLTVRTAPVIITQPSPVNACQGMQVSFGAVAQGSLLTWQWMKDGADLPESVPFTGTTTPTVTIDPVEMPHQGIYSARITGYCGSISTNPVSLAVTPALLINSHPEDVSACEGLPVSFSVNATGANAYQWQKDNTDLPGETSATLTLPAISQADAGTYSCRVFSVCDTLVTHGALLTVNINTVINQQPTSQVSCEGDMATLVIDAAGDGLNYQWKHNGTDLADNGIVAGSASHTLVINPLSLSHQGLYHCVVTGTCGEVTSTAATVDVNENITIIQQPGAITICLGETAAFSVQATGMVTDYQWQKNGTDLPGANAQQFEITSVAAGDTGIYRCILTGPCGQVFSEGALLDIDLPPVLTTLPPLSQTVCKNNAILLALTAEGSNLDYQWYHNGLPLSDNDTIAGATTASLVISPANELHQGTYFCTIENICATAVTPGSQVWINNPAVITQQPKNTQACTGEDVSLIVAAEGDNLTYQWMRGTAVIGGANAPVYTLNNITPADSGIYQININSSCGSILSGAARITVSEPVSVSVNPPALVEQCQGTTVTLQVSGSGDILAYQWKRNGIALSNNAHISGVNLPVLQIDAIEPGDEGLYTCEITGFCNAVTTTVTQLDVLEAPVIDLHPADYALLAGGNASFSTTASGDNLSYQWYFNSAPLANGGSVSGSDQQTVQLTGVSAANEGNYSVTVSGTCGTATSNPALLSLLSTSVITTQPVGATHCAGETMSVYIQTAGTGHTYQWKRNGTNLTDDVRISGSSEATLTISNLAPADAGPYNCLVDGIENSIPAIVYVNRTTEIIDISGITNVCDGEAIVIQTTATGDSLRYEWFRDGTGLSDDGIIAGTSTPVISIYPANTGHQGSYTSRVTGACGTQVTDPQVISVSVPATITAQPVGDTICEGQPAIISLSASGSNPVYQWLKDGNVLTDNERISGTTSPSLTINNALLTDMGAYSCIVTSACDTVYSVAASLSVTANVAILQQPASVSRCTGDAATFVISTNSMNATFQWHKDGVALSDDARINGSALPVLTITGIQVADSGTYECIVTGACNTVVSNPVHLNVNSIPVITGQPVGGSLCTGQSYTLSVAATGSNLAYQWTKDGIILTDAGAFSGTNAADLIVTSAGTGESGVYQCLVTGTCGNLASSPAVLTVNKPVVFTTQPVNRTICSGNQLTLTAIASGSITTYQWYKDGIALSDGVNMAGSNTSVLSITNIAQPASGTYHCVATGLCNVITSAPSLVTVIDPPSVTSDPAGITVCENQHILLQTQASGSNLAYQWKVNGISFTDSANVSGSQTGDLQIQLIKAESAGLYTCEVSNTCGSVNSNPAAVMVNIPATIVSQPQPVSACQGEQVSLAVSATGDNLQYQWKQQGINITDNATTQGSQANVLTLSSLSSSHQGDYQCVITDLCGNTLNSEPVTVTVNEPVVITAQTLGDTLCSGESITLSVSATGSIISYQWYRNGKAINDSTGIAGAHTASLILSDINPAIAGYYTCQVTGNCNTVVTSPKPVAVNAPVAIETQPGSLSLCAGSLAAFQVKASGDSLVYRWMKNGTPLSDGGNIHGSNTALLMIDNVTSPDAGSYQCQLTGACGPMNSQPAMLTVNIYPGPAGIITGDTVVCQGAKEVVYRVDAIPGATGYNWHLPPGMVITGGLNTNQVVVSFSLNESGGPLSVAGVNACGQGPSSPILQVVANPLPLAYAGENRGICNNQTTLTAYPPETGATGFWQVFSGPAVIDQPGQAITNVSDLRNGDNIFTWTVTKNGCPVTDTLVIANNQLIVEAGNDTSICNHIYTLNATAPEKETGEWSIVSGSGYNISRYNPSSIVSGLSQGTNVFKWTVTLNGCASYDTVAITNNLPTEADAGKDQHIQADNTNLNANNPTIGTGEWSLLNGAATIDDRYAFNTLLTGLGKGSNIFAWTISHAGCISSDTVVIENILTDTTDAGPNQVICSNTVRLNAKNPYPGYGEWSVKRGSATFADNSLYNTYAYNLAQGENVLVWTAYLNGITSDSVLIINNLPTTANAGVNLSVCEDSVNLNANLPYIGSGTWSVISGSGVFENASSNTTLVTHMAQGNNNFKWTITNGTCTSSSVVTITNNKPSTAEAGFDAVICEDTIVLSPNVPTFGIGEWSVVSGAAKFNGNIASDLGTDDNMLVYTIRNSGCYSRDTVVITSHKPTTARLGADQSVCQDSVLLTANNPVTGTGVWTIQSGSANIADVSSATTEAVNLDAGNNVFRWTITYQGCTSYDDMTISNDFVEANAGPDQTLCSNRALLAGNNPGLSQGVWSVIGGATGADISDPHAFNAVVENLAQGDNILRWTITKNSCVSYDEVTLTNNLPTKAFAGEDAYLCSNEASLRANSITIGQGTWSILSGSGTFSDIHAPTAVFSNMGSGANLLRWTSENEGCTTTDEVIISNNLPVNVYAGLDQALCDDSTLLYANPPSLGTGVWSVIQGSAVFSDPYQYNTVVSKLGNGTNRLKWTVATTGCSVTDTVEITNNLPSVAVAGSDFSVCNSVGPLNANTPLYGNGEWSIISGAGTIESVSSARTSVRDLALGDNILRWTITSANCTSTDDLLITNNSPTIAAAGENAEVCGETAVLFANSPAVGYGYWTVMSGNGDFVDSLNYNTTINGLQFGDNILRWTTVNGLCKTIDEIVVTNNLADVYAGEDKAVYEPQTLLAGNNPESGTGAWVLVAGEATIESPASFSTNVTQLGAGLNTFEWTITNGSCTATDQVVIHYKVMPRVGFTVSTSTGCPGTTVDFVNTTQYGTTYRWELGDGTISTDVNPSHTYNYADQYMVRLIAYGPDDRQVISDTLITIHPNPIASFQFAPDTAFVNKPMRCYNLSSEATSFLWEFGDQVVSAEENPTHTYQAGGTYSITLMVTTDAGCTDTTAQTIFVAEDGKLVFPNAFTPNPSGSNGGQYNTLDTDNDVFHPYFENVEDYHMEIYSRWGVLLFETSDINIGWDGYYKGELMAKDVYVWKVSGRYVGGSEFVKTGAVLLIR